MEECFIICPIGSENSESRKRSDKLLKHVFKPVLDRNDYKALRADQIPKVGLITTQIINLIIEVQIVATQKTICFTVQVVLFLDLVIIKEVNGPAMPLRFLSIRLPITTIE